MKFSNRLSNSFKGDPIMWIVLLLLALYSLLAIYSATDVMADSTGSTTLKFLVKQIVLLTAGVFLRIVVIG